MDAPASHGAGAAPTKPFTVAIAGGGLGGVVLALGLRQHGVPFHIYEAAASFGEIGAGVAFGPNSVRSLGLISPELLKAYKMHATFNASPALSTTFLSIRRGMEVPRNSGTESATGAEAKKSGELLFHVTGDKHANSWTGTPTRCCVHRAKFLNEIIKMVPAGTASFKKSLTKVAELPDEEGGGVRLFFADGTSATASAVVGCDGIKSKTRQHLHGPGAQPEFAGEYAYRAIVPAEAYAEIMGREMTFNGQLYLGYGSYAVTYPVEHAKSINIVAVLSEPGSEWKHETWLMPSTREEMVADLQGWHPGLVELLSRYGTMDRWALFDNLHDERYCRGPVCLLGDSAHATTPHLGAGAGQAMEDAYVLSNLLGMAERAEDLPKCFEAYDAVRRPRTQRVVKWSRLTGLTYAGLEKEIGDDLPGINEALHTRYHWLWDEDLELQLEHAKARVAGAAQ